MNVADQAKLVRHVEFGDKPLEWHRDQWVLLTGRVRREAIDALEAYAFLVGVDLCWVLERAIEVYAEECAKDKRVRKLRRVRYDAFADLNVESAKRVPRP